MTEYLQWWSNPWLVVLMGVAFVVIVLFVAFLLWMSHREKMARPKEKRNPYLIVLILGFSIIALCFLAVFFGVLPRDWMSKNGWWFFPLIIISMIVFSGILVLRSRSKPIEKAIERGLFIIDRIYHAREIYGEEQGYTVKCAKKGFEMDENQKKNPVANLFLWVKGQEKFMVIMQISLMNLALNYVHQDPSIEMVEKELKKDIGVVADAYIEAKQKYEEETKEQGEEKT